MLHYDHRALIAHSESKGMPWDAQAAAGADLIAFTYGFTQDQFETAMTMHIDRTAETWDVKRYPWKSRIVIALYWLGLFRK